MAKKKTRTKRPKRTTQKRHQAKGKAAQSDVQCTHAGEPVGTEVGRSAGEQADELPRLLMEWAEKGTQKAAENVVAAQETIESLSESSRHGPGRIPSAWKQLLAVAEKHSKRGFNRQCEEARNERFVAHGRLWAALCPAEDVSFDYVREKTLHPDVPSVAVELCVMSMGWANNERSDEDVLLDVRQFNATAKKAMLLVVDEDDLERVGVACRRVRETNRYAEHSREQPDSGNAAIDAHKREAAANLIDSISVVSQWDTDQKQEAVEIPRCIGKDAWEPNPWQREIIGLLSKRENLRRTGSRSWVPYTDEELKQEREEINGRERSRYSGKIAPMTNEALACLLSREDKVEGTMRGCSVSTIRREMRDRPGTSLVDQGIVVGRAETGKAGWRLTKKGQNLAKKLSI